MPDEFRSKENFQSGDEWLTGGGGTGAQAPPAITTLTPSTVGNTPTTVAVAGTFLSDVTTVNHKLGASGASGTLPPNINSPTSLTFLADFATDGVYTITVTSPDGTSSGLPLTVS
jgi:hypothetical protein